MDIVYPAEQHLKSFHEALDAVAREQIYIEMIEAKPFEETANFQRKLIANNWPVYYAIDGARVVGWAALEHSKKIGLEKVELTVYTENTEAIKLYKKMGFSEIGVIKHYRKLNGKYFDSVEMEVFL